MAPELLVIKCPPPENLPRYRTIRIDDYSAGIIHGALTMRLNTARRELKYMEAVKVWHEDPERNRAPVMPLDVIAGTLASSINELLEQIDPWKSMVDTYTYWADEFDHKQWPDE